MDAVNIHGYGPVRPLRRLMTSLALVVVVSSVQTIASVQSEQQAAHAAVFKPTTPTELVDAFAAAGENAEDDIIDLGWHTFDLTDELFLKPDNGHSLELRNGTLERSEDAEPFRLLNLLEVPTTVPHDGLPVLIEDVQFKNGLYRNNESFVGGDSGGGALLSNRNTLINKAHFVNNRTLGNEAGARLLIGNGNFLGNVADLGGAIYAADKVVDLSVTRSSFDGNEAQSNGGAIWSNISEGGIRITNTSFIANQAPMGGGAFYTQTSNASITLVHLTMLGNKSAPGMGAGIRTLEPLDDSELFLRNSVLADNTGGNCSGIERSSLQTTYSSHNVMDDNSCGHLAVDKLTDKASVVSDTFAYYGSIPTMPVEVASQARNLVPRVDCSSFDSRDIPRLDNGFIPDTHCDAGAFEYVPQEYIDLDGDNVGNRSDNCLRVSNPLQSDIDGDGRGDECDRRDDRDSDEDVVLNFQDNCPALSNFLQLDRNGNGIGDACEQMSVRLTLAPLLR